MNNTLVGRYMDEAYADYARRFCARIGEPWKPEYADPIIGPYPMSPPFGPLAQARQDKALEKMRERAE